MLKTVYLLKPRSRKLLAKSIGKTANFNFYIHNLPSIFYPSQLERWLLLEEGFLEPSKILNFRGNLLCRGLVNKPHEPFGFFIKYSSVRNTLSRLSINSGFFKILRSLYQELLVCYQTFSPHYRQKVVNAYFAMLKLLRDHPSTMASVSNRLLEGDRLVGSPRHIYLKSTDNYITESFVRHFQLILKISGFIELNSIHSVIEIGSGFGGFAEILLSVSKVRSYTVY